MLLCKCERLRIELGAVGVTHEVPFPRGKTCGGDDEEEEEDGEDSKAFGGTILVRTSVSRWAYNQASTWAA